VLFNARSGFDAEACAAIESTLPPGANPDAVFIHLENAASAYHRPKRDAAQERKRIARRLKLIDELAADLRDERRRPSIADDNGATRRTLEGLGELKLQAKTLLVRRMTRVRAQKGRAVPDRELLYARLLQIWTEAGGRLGITPTTSTGGPLAQFMTVTLRAITGRAPKRSGLRKIVQRWR
jgi:hypothetical protein